jgi:tripartite-type tricarboxylate transporter receptor subunit TctC
MKMEKIVKRFGVIFVVVVSTTVLLIAGNASAANWPEKGKIINYYMPSGSGGFSDIVARTFQPFLEAELGSKIVVLVKPGGAGQVGTTEFLSRSGTDGYTVLQASQMNTPAVYLDPERKTPYGRKDLQLVAKFADVIIGIAVKKGSPYKNLKDLVEAARANPGKIKVTVSGPMNTGDMGLFLLEKVSGVKFAHVIYDNQGEQRAVLLGGHVDAECNPTSELMAAQKSGEIETLGILDSEESEFLPGVKTAEAQGYKAYISAGTTLVYKMGTPMEIVNTMAAAVKKAAEKPECQMMFKKMGIVRRVSVGQELTDSWNSTEDLVRTVYADVGKLGKK